MNNNTLIALTILTMLCASCSSKPKTSAALDPFRDYSTPYLTDEKVTKFIECSKNEINPLARLYAPEEYQRKQEELNAFARKCGFQDVQDYVVVWRRIFEGETHLAIAPATERTKKMLSDNIERTQRELQNRNLSPQERKTYENQLWDDQKLLNDARKPTSSSLNDPDLALVKKYLPQVEEAEKRLYEAGQK
jgi:hypothetical protein